MTEQTPTLWGCPFCGGRKGEYVTRNDVLHIIRCVTCEANTGAKLTFGDAANAWNRRAIFDSTNETQVATLALAGFELERDHWAAPDYSQHESRLREWARVTLGKLGGGG